MKAQPVDVMGILHTTTVTIHIRRAREARWRLWAARQIVRFAGWVGGLRGLEIDEQ